MQYKKGIVSDVFGPPMYKLVSLKHTELFTRQLHCCVVIASAAALTFTYQPDRFSLSGPLPPINGLQPAEVEESVHKVDSGVLGSSTRCEDQTGKQTVGKCHRI